MVKENDATLLVMALDALFNLTPHPINFFAPEGQKLLYVLPTHGTLRLVSGEQPKVKNLWAGMTMEACVPVIMGQRFIGLDTSGPGYKIWQENPTAGFIVSLPMAQWLSTQHVLCGAREIYCPATDTKNRVSDDRGQLIGCRALELHTPR